MKPTMKTMYSFLAPVLRSLLVASITLVGFSATAQEAAIRKNLAERLPNFSKIDEVKQTAMPGLYEVRIESNLFYTDAKGDYLIQGELMDVKERRNLTEERMNKLNAVAFNSLPLKDAFTIVRGNGKRKLAVFEDPNCGYCKRFEQDLQNVDNVTSTCSSTRSWALIRPKSPAPSGAPKTAQVPGRTGWCVTNHRVQPRPNVTPMPSHAPLNLAKNTASPARLP